MRREVFDLKESVNNVVKHSQCTEATAQFSYQRATELGGEFKIVTAQSRGTTVWLSVPLAGLSEN